jgi:hypothetical protein
MKIKYLRYFEIDKDRWNECVHSAPNSLIYGMSWYLDLVCENWDALVAENYDAVMPLPWKKKYGISYIYHPWFAQQLGIFAKEPEHYPINEFIKVLPRKFLRYEFSFNYLNTFKSLSTQSKTNNVLSLSSSYPELASHYSENTQRNIKKATHHNVKEIDTDTFIRLLINEIGPLMDTKNQQNLNKLVPFLIQHKHATILGIESKNGELLGAVFLVRFKNRLIHLFSAASEQGKKERVVFKIMDQIIKENCESGNLLDFEGSRHEGIARFYKGFGSQPEVYHSITKKFFGFI